MYPQLRKLIPARAKPDIGLLVEPNIFERPKVVRGKDPFAENRFYSSSINVGNIVDGSIVVTGSYNQGAPITNYDAYTGRIDIYSYETGSSVISSSGEKVFDDSALAALSKIYFITEVIGLERKYFERNFRSFNLVFKSKN